MPEPEPQVTDARALDEAYRPPEAALDATARPLGPAFVVVAGVAITLSSFVIGVIPWALRWIHVPPRSLVDPVVFEAVMAPLDLRLAIVRLAFGLAALPGLLALGRAAGSKDWRAPLWVRVTAVGWPGVAAIEIAYRLVSSTRIPLEGLFHNPDLLAGLSAVSLIGQARGRKEAFGAIAAGVAAVHVVSIQFGKGLPIGAREALGYLMMAGFVVLGATVAWSGPRVFEGKPLSPPGPGPDSAGG